MVMKNLVDRQKYLIHLNFTYRFFDISRDFWNALGIFYTNNYLMYQDIIFNIRILHEVFYGDT